MSNNHNISEELVRDYYRRSYKKNKVCSMLIGIGMIAWAADVYIGLTDTLAPIVLVGQLLAMVSLVLLCFTECPSCKRYNFRQPKCSVCSFPLIKSEK